MIAGLLFQLAALATAPDTTRLTARLEAAVAREPVTALDQPVFGPNRLYQLMNDTTRRRRPPAIQYSDVYHTRVGIHRALSWAMVPLFVGSAVTGFQLRNKREAAPQWARDLHGPLAGGTAVLFGMNSLTGVWNLIEGRKDPVDRTRRLIHSAMFLAAGAGFVYVTAAGDNIHAEGKPNHWHRDVALGSMTISLVSWSLMLFR